MNFSKGMKGRFIKNGPVLLILLITLVFAKLQVNKMGGDRANACMGICSDGRGYYAWLPAIFIYDDINFNFFEQVEIKEPLCGGEIAGCLQDYRSCTNGITGNKYYPGTSFLMLPFFAIAHIGTTYFTDMPADGYSRFYFVMIAISGICFYFISMYLILKILVLTGLSRKQQLVAILLLTFGSNIMYFAVDKPSYSHIYSCAEIAALIYCMLLLKKRFTARALIIGSFILGLIFITRPVNVSVLLLVPFLFYSDFKAIKDGLIARPSRLLLLLPGLIMPAVLFYMYKVSLGQFFVYSYGSEGFHFTDPYFFHLLFSYNNGIFPYTPLLLLPFFLAFIWLKKVDVPLVAGVFVTMLVTIYIHSAWWCWWYGFSFGARSLLDFLPVFGLVIGISLKSSNKKQQWVLLPTYFLSCVLTMLLYHMKNHGFMNNFPIDDYWEAIKSVVG
jgi:hypothetical protein